MSNKYEHKIHINPGILYNAIKAKTSIRKLGPEIGYSEKTIRRALKEEVISLDLAISISKYLQINLYEFVILHTEEERLFVFLNNNFPKEGVKVKTIESGDGWVKVIVEIPK